MTLAFEITDILPTSPQAIYHAWLDSAGHAAMTGSPATASDQVGGQFSAWDGYISGRNLELQPGRRILQAWRSSEFTDSDPDSTLEVLLTAHEQGTLVTIRHANLPDGGEQYRQGWIDFYFTPMHEYFTRLVPGEPS